MVDAKRKIGAALGYSGISQAELARRLDVAPQLLNKRIATGKFALSEWEQIAKAIGAKFEMDFVFPDGGRI